MALSAEPCLVRSAVSVADLNAVRELLREYAAELNVDLEFQGFTEELANLPGAYAPPQGRLLLAAASSQVAGCVALRPLSASCAEVKRLFIRNAYRRQGIGRKLIERLLVEAREIGYECLRLDTLASMEPALRLYRSFGFIEISAYYDTCLANTRFLELRLR